MKSVVFDISKFANARIAVFGDFMVDEYLLGDVSRISPEAPVPVVCIDDKKFVLGGAGNVVSNLTSLGAKVFAIGVVGNDAQGNWVFDQLKKQNVDTRGLVADRNYTTTVKTRITSKNQQLLRYDCEKITDPFCSRQEEFKAIVSEILSLVDAIIISDYAKGTVTEETAQVIIREANHNRTPVIIDPKGRDYYKYSGATILTPNMSELEVAIGEKIETEEKLLKAAIDLGEKYNLKYVLATRSEKGLSLINSDSKTKKDYPTMAKEVVDVTGAGDTVISVFSLCYALEANMDDCCNIANTAAAIVCSKFGTSSVSINEIQDFIYKERRSCGKVFEVNELLPKLEDVKREGKKVVFTNGCFDIVHAGHVSSFKQAKQFGDILVLGLNSDTSIRRIKGNKRPIVSQNYRAKLLEAISLIDYIVFFDDDTPENLIRSIKPDVLVKGRDWEGKEVSGSKFITENGGTVQFIDLEQGLSTTSIINKIVDAYGKE